MSALEKAGTIQRTYELITRIKGLYDGYGQGSGWDINLKKQCKVVFSHVPWWRKGHVQAQRIGTECIEILFLFICNVIFPVRKHNCIKNSLVDKESAKLFIMKI